MSALTSSQITELQGYVNSGNRIQYWSKLAEFQHSRGQDNRYALLGLGVAAPSFSLRALAVKSRVIYYVCEHKDL
jgi:hypothetical protein